MIQIYQAGRDVPYAFMDFSVAAKYGIQREDYLKVLEFDLDNASELSDSVILDWVWNKGNDGTLQKKYNTKNMRSISMSDIIKINDKAYYVDTFGFKEVEL